MSRRSGPGWVVFGAGDDPSKCLVVRPPKDGGGTWELLICQIKDGAQYEYGAEVSAEDLDGLFFTLYFCKPDSVRAFIRALEIILEGMES